MSKIKVLVTGGTFDKEHDPIGETFIFKNTHIPEILQKGKSTLDINVKTLMMIDSLDMSQADRLTILKACEEAEEDKIIITHGTSNMDKTAMVLGERIKNKTIVLTGALVPYVFGNSDGMFNLGCALAFAQSLQKGVYITMNGKYFHHNNVKKNLITGKFECINIEQKHL